MSPKGGSPVTVPARPAYGERPEGEDGRPPGTVDLLEAPARSRRPPPVTPYAPPRPQVDTGRAPRRGGGPRGPSGIDPRPGHIPGLDGIRALAILGVLVFHYTPALLPGGFLGVDVFFVVSGFLITTLLMRELAQRGRIDLPRFWLRRARRLLPALFTVVVLSVAAARVVGGDLLVAIGRQTFGALTFSTNWVEIAAGASYFHSTSPLLFVNFWSLAVEEQFYLLWPFGLVLVLALTSGTRHRLYVAGGLALASATAMAVLYTPGEDATRVYYGTDTHAFGLMLGVALAFAWAGPERAWLRTETWRRWRGAAVGLSLLTLVGLMVVLTEATAFTFRGGILLACLATVVLIAGLLESNSPWRLWMSLPVLGWLGSRSYGLYLWHWPVLVIAAALVPFAHGTLRGWLVVSTALLVSFVITELSYRLVETPIRRHGFLAPLRSAARWLATPWTHSRLPRLVAGGLALVLLLTVVAVLTAPEKSETQRQIEAAEAAMNAPVTGSVARVEAARGLALGTMATPVEEGAGAPAVDEALEEAEEALEEEAEPADEGAEAAEQPASGAAADWGWAEDEDGLLVPAGEDLTAIGDSLVVTSRDGLSYRFPDISYAAKSNRQWKDALPVLEQALAEGSVRDNVVVHFGTNAGVDEEQARAFVEALGPDRRVVLMNLYGSSTFVPGSNEVIAEIAADHPNVVVGDWQAAATAQPETLQSDRIHPDIDGMHVYAEVVAESFDALARGEG
jgi:peptidoglycan/LPS O-acetylase OafA/YrhL